MAKPTELIGRALTAAAVAIQGSGKGDSHRTQAAPWQADALGYYDSVGEIRYAANFYAILGRVDYMVCTGDRENPVPVVLEEGGDEPVDANAAEVSTVWDRLQDPGGGRGQLLGTYGKLRFLVGESYLCATWESGAEEIEGVTPPLEEKWETLSVDELEIKKSDSKAIRYFTDRDKKEYALLRPGDEAEADSMLVIRLWKRHPRRSGIADSSMRTVLELCDELLLLRRAIRGRTRSRIADAGLLLVPEQAFLDQAAPPGTDDDAMKDPLFSKLIETFTAPLVNEGSAASVVPAMFRMDAQFIEAVKLIRFRDPGETYPEIQLRQDCVTAIARALPLPAEVITGLADVNHWGQWFISDQTWKHLEPDCIDLCEELTDAYLRPMLADEGVDDVEQYFVWFDPAAVVVRPDRGKDAKDLHDRFAISDEALRDSAAFAEEDAPDEEEVAQRILIQQALHQNTAPASGAGQESVIQGPPAENQAPESAAAVASALAWLNGGLDMGLMRCYEQAGNKLRTLAQKKKLDVDGIPNYQLAAHLGHDQVIALAGTSDAERTLVSGGAQTLVPSLMRAGANEVVARMIAAAVEDEAARRLCQADAPALAH